MQDNIRTLQIRAEAILYWPVLAPHEHPHAQSAAFIHAHRHTHLFIFYFLLNGSILMLGAQEH